jgi:glutamyl-tRNA reductase
MVIGVSCGTAPVAIRERFCIREDRRAEALQQLSRSEGIDEVVVLATGQRTEFLLWTRDAFAASGSVLSFLTRDYGLRRDDWGHFYRKLDRTALEHLLGLLSGLEAGGEPEMAAQAKSAWALAQQLGASKWFLDSVMQRALNFSERLRPMAAGQGRAILDDVAKRLYAELQAESARPAAAATRH